MKSLLVFIGILALVWIGYSLFTYTVDETQKAVLLQLGEIRKVVEDPGLHFKTPFIQNVVYLEDRLLHYDIQPAPVITVDKQRLTVDTYTIWRISDARLYMETLRGLRNNAQQRLDDIVYSLLRDVLGQKTFDEVLERDFLADVKLLAAQQVIDFGIEIVDIRIKRAELPETNEQQVFDRMINERLKVAQKLRAEGEKEAQRIRAEANKNRDIIVAQANKIGEETKGEGDAEALQIYAEAYNQDQEFFMFWRTLESYKKAISGEYCVQPADDASAQQAEAICTPNQTALVLTTGSDYFKLLNLIDTKKLAESFD